MLIHRRIISPPAYVHLDEGKHYEMSGVGRTDHNATDPEWKVPSASKYRDTAYLFGVQGTSVFVHLFYKGKVTLARLLQTAVNTDHVKETSLIRVTLSYKVNLVIPALVGLRRVEFAFRRFQINKSLTNSTNYTG